MKVRVIKEMPFAKVGDIWEITSDGLVNNDTIYCDLAIENFKGFVEEVKEESWVKRACPHCVDEFEQKMLWGAKEHRLEVFDKFLESQYIGINLKTNPPMTINIQELRKALEQG